MRYKGRIATWVLLVFAPAFIACGGDPDNRASEGTGGDNPIFRATASARVDSGLSEADYGPGSDPLPIWNRARRSLPDRSARPQ
jgi:hypothetical protein